MCETWTVCCYLFVRSPAIKSKYTCQFNYSADLRIPYIMRQNISKVESNIIFLQNSGNDIIIIHKTSRAHSTKELGFVPFPRVLVKQEKKKQLDIFCVTAVPTQRSSLLFQLLGWGTKVK